MTSDTVRLPKFWVKLLKEWRQKDEADIARYQQKQAEYEGYDFISQLYNGKRLGLSRRVHLINMLLESIEEENDGD